MADESQRGYRLRLAHANGVAICSWMRRVDGIVPARQDIEHVRWCSHCLAEGGAYWRKSWGTGVPICLHHQCWLLDTCSSCQRKLSWRGLNFLECSCGASLADTETMPLQSHVAAIFQNRGDNGPPAAWWNTLSTFRKWKVARFLGTLFQYGLMGKPFKKASVSELVTERNIVDAGTEILPGGEPAFHYLLQRIRLKPSNGIQVQALKEGFPGLLIRMRKQLDESEYAVFQTYIRSYLLAAADEEIPLTWRNSDNRAMVGATECARTLRIRHERVRQMLALHGLTPKERRSASGRNMLAIAPETMERLRDNRDAAISRKVVATTFGLPVSRQDSLIDEGLLLAMGPMVDGRSVVKLFTAIGQRKSDYDDKSNVEFVRLDMALRTLVPISLNGAFFRAMADGKIAVRTLIEKCNHVRDFAIRKADARALLDRQRQLDDRFLSIPDLAARIGVKEEVAYQLVNCGLIRTRYRKVGRRSARFVALREINRFSNTYEMLVDAAKRAGISKQGALQWARARNVKIVSGPCIDGGRQYFVEKT